jgi:ribosomal-protein-alanine N-acetyltransferase
LETTRLNLKEVTVADSEFILELVNTYSWIRFIGDRKVRSEEEAKVFIQKINDNPNLTYWVISRKSDSQPVGIISFAKRDYLEHHDIGFALLPQYEHLGFAYEAASHALQIESRKRRHKRILAITKSDNQKSIQLLEKLGLRFKEEIVKDSEQLLVYST